MKEKAFYKIMAEGSNNNIMNLSKWYYKPEIAAEKCREMAKKHLGTKFFVMKAVYHAKAEIVLTYGKTQNSVHYVESEAVLNHGNMGDAIPYQTQGYQKK